MMLPITGHATRSAVPSNQAAARVSQQEGEESFAETMQRAQGEPGAQDAATGNAPAQSKPVDELAEEKTSADSASALSADADGLEQSVPQGSAAKLVDVAGDALAEPALHGKAAAKATAGKQTHAVAKHGRQGTANEEEKNIANAVTDTVANGCVVTASAETAAKVKATGDGVVATASGTTTKGVKTVSVEQAAQAVTAAFGEKNDTPQAAMADASSAAVNDAAGKMTTHATLEIAKVEPAPVEKAVVTGGVATVPVIARAEGSHSVKASGAATASASSGGSSMRASAGDEMSVTSYEASAGNRLEIGVAGGSWGWLKVRAEMGQSGEVHAFLRGASAGAESALRAQAGDLQMYLGTQQVGVREVHVEASRSSAWGAGAGMSEGERQPAAQRERTFGRSQVVSKAMREDVFDQWMPLPQGLHGAGGWLNVLA